MAVAHFPSVRRAKDGSHDAVRLVLIGTFRLIVGGFDVSLPHGAQRLMAFLGLNAGPMSRSRVAGQLWPDVTEARALGNLRSALWRLHRVDEGLIRTFDDRVSLSDGVLIDVSDLMTAAHGHGSSHDALADLSVLLDGGELLPGWEEEWVVGERERLRQARTHALERWCEALLEAGDYAAAEQAAQAAIDADPLRDSAHRLLLRVHLADGNAAAAIHVYATYRDLMQVELGLPPSDAMQLLVATVDRRARDAHVTSE